MSEGRSKAGRAGASVLGPSLRYSVFVKVLPRKRLALVCLLSPSLRGRGPSKRVSTPAATGQERTSRADQTDTGQLPPPPPLSQEGASKGGSVHLAST